MEIEKTNERRVISVSTTDSTSGIIANGEATFQSGKLTSVNLDLIRNKDEHTAEHIGSAQYEQGSNTQEFLHVYSEAPGSIDAIYGIMRAVVGDLTAETV